MRLSIGSVAGLLGVIALALVLLPQTRRFGKEAQDHGDAPDVALGVSRSGADPSTRVPADAGRDPAWTLPREEPGAPGEPGTGIGAGGSDRQRRPHRRAAGRRHAADADRRVAEGGVVERGVATRLDPQVDPEPEPEPRRLAPFVRFGGGPPGGPETIVADEDALEIMVALNRLEDSGAFRRLSREELPRVVELMPDSQGVQDADRIFRERLGMGVGEFLEEQLARSAEDEAG